MDRPRNRVAVVVLCVDRIHLVLINVLNRLMAFRSRCPDFAGTLTRGFITPDAIIYSFPLSLSRRSRRLLLLNWVTGFALAKKSRPPAWGQWRSHLRARPRTECAVDGGGLLRGKGRAELEVATGGVVIAKRQHQDSVARRGASTSIGQIAVFRQSSAGGQGHTCVPPFSSATALKGSNRVRHGSSPTASLRPGTGAQRQTCPITIRTTSIGKFQCNATAADQIPGPGGACCRGGVEPYLGVLLGLPILTWWAEGK